MVNILITIKEIYNFIDKLAPFNTALDFDNSGFLIGDINAIVKNVLLSLDVTPDVVYEAQNLGANLIISHHPVIFRPIKNINFNTAIHLLSKFDIGVLSAHTNLDMSDYGVNTCLAKRLGLRNLRSLFNQSFVDNKSHFKKIIVFSPPESAEKIIDNMSRFGAGHLGNYSKCNFTSNGKGAFYPNKSANPYSGENEKYSIVDEIKIEMICPDRKVNDVIKAMLDVHPYEEPAFDIFDNYGIQKNNSLGLIGDLETVTDINIFAKFVRDRLNCNGLRYTDCKKQIKTVAVSSGAGGEFIKYAIEKKVDVFVTGEIKHNFIVDANNNGVSIVDAGHYKTEDVIIDFLLEYLSANFNEIKFYKSKEFSDRIKYI